jgi:hypothetical protein
MHTFLFASRWMVLAAALIALATGTGAYAGNVPLGAIYSSVTTPVDSAWVEQFDAGGLRGSLSEDRLLVRAIQSVQRGDAVQGKSYLALGHGFVSGSTTAVPLRYSSPIAFGDKAFVFRFLMLGEATSNPLGPEQLTLSRTTEREVEAANDRPVDVVIPPFLPDPGLDFDSLAGLKNADFWVPTRTFAQRPAQGVPTVLPTTGEVDNLAGVYRRRIFDQGAGPALRQITSLGVRSLAGSAQTGGDAVADTISTGSAWVQSTTGELLIVPADPKPGDVRGWAVAVASIDLGAQSDRRASGAPEPSQWALLMAGS